MFLSHQQHSLWTYFLRNILFKWALALLVIFNIVACSDANRGSSSIKRYVLAQENMSVKPAVIESMPTFINYQPHLYSLNPSISPFGMLEQSRRNIVPFLESVPLNQIRMVGMVYFKNQSWGLVAIPNDMRVERVGTGTILGSERGKVVSVTFNTIIVEDSLESSLKIEAVGAGSMRRTALHLM